MQGLYAGKAYADKTKMMEALRIQRITGEGGKAPFDFLPGDGLIQECTRVLHPLRFFKLEDTAGIIIALVSALMIPSSILSGDSFYADMRVFNENSR